jgi:hypothetical protein
VNSVEIRSQLMDSNDHLFDCPLARYNWSVVCTALGVSNKPDNIFLSMPELVA